MRFPAARIVLLFSVFLFPGSQLPAQGRFEVSGGAGFPDYLNLKARCGRNFQIGLGLGFYPDNTAYSGSASVEVYYHFGKVSQYTEQKIWYLLPGFARIYSDGEGQTFHFYFRAGRTFTFSPHGGMTFDLGLVSLSRESLGWFPLPFLPSGNLGFFLRF